MQNPVAVTLLSLCLSAAAAPALFVLGQSDEQDANDLYLLVGTGGTLDITIRHTDIREIGPYRAPFGRIVTASPAQHAQLIRNNHWIFPATRLAEICGISPQA